MGNGREGRGPTRGAKCRLEAAEAASKAFQAFSYEHCRRPNTTVLREEMRTSAPSFAVATVSTASEQGRERGASVAVGEVPRLGLAT